MTFSPIQILGSFQQAVSLVFLLSALSLLYVQKKFRISTLKFNISLCVFGGLYAFFLGLSQYGPTVDQTRIIQHLVWVSGVFFLFSYVAAVEQFLQTESRAIRFVRAALFAIGMISLLCMLYYFVTGKMILYSEGAIATQDIFITETERNSLTPNGLTMALGASAFIFQLIAISVFLKRMVSQKQDRILIATTLLGCVAVLYEIRLAVLPAKYGFSVLFVAGLLESFRLAFLSIKKTVIGQEQMQRSVFDARFLVQALGLGIWRWDVVQNKLEWNETNYKLYGMNPDGFSGALDSWESRLHPDDRERTNKELMATVNEGKPWDTFFKIVLPHGGVRYIGAKGVVDRDAQGKALRMTGVNWDATELMTERMKRLQLNEQLESITKNIPGLVFRLRQDGDSSITMPFVVGDGLGMLELSSADYDADHCVVINQIHPEDWNAFRSALNASAKSLSQTNWIGRFNTRSGKVKWGYLSAMPQRISESRTLWNGVLMDITKEKELEEQVNFERGRAIQNSKLASLGEMSAGIAHEINNPLMVINGSVNLLEKMAGEPEKLRERIDAIQKSVERIAKIVNGLRKFARSAQTEKMEPRKISEIVNEAILLTRNKAVRHHTPVTFDNQYEGMISCNEIEIEQVLINLINNAIDAVKGLQERWVKISLFDEGDEAVLRVSDSGKGIPEEIEKKLFEPFFTTKRQGAGTGLGLSISKGILDQHHATITLLTGQPHTCFEIRFKRVDGSTAVL